MSMMKANTAKAPSKVKAPEKAMPSVSKVLEKAMSKLPAKTTTTAVMAAERTPAKAGKRQNSQEAMLARVEAVRLMQRQEGHFDCFGKAGSGYCDQGECAHHAECLSVSQMMLAM